MSDTEDPFEQMARVINANAKTATQLDAAAKAISASANTTAAEARRAVESVRAAVAGLSPEGAAKAFSEALAGVRRDAGSITAATQRLEKAADTLALNRWLAWGGALFLLLLAGGAGWIGWTFGVMHEDQTIGDQKAAAAWSSTREGQAAWKLAQANYVGLFHDMAKCSASGWTETTTKDDRTLCVGGPATAPEMAGVGGWFISK